MLGTPVTSTQPTLDDVAFQAVPLIDTTFCVIDLETTGTGPDARITEIGAVKVRGGEKLGEFQTLVNPGVEISPFITGLTGITNEKVRRAPHLREVFPSLIEFARGCLMVAHNAGFDMGFILRAAEGLDYEWPSPNVLDTVRLARRIVPKSEVGNYRLHTLTDYFSTPVSPTHRALDDARATVDLLHALLERVGNRSVTTVEDLLDYSHMITDKRRRRRVWAKDLPEGPGVYFFVRDSDRGRQHLYVGTSKHIRRRVATYFTSSETRRRMEEMVNLATGVEAVECHTALEAAVVELRLITAHQPPYNRRSKNPSLTWIRTTTEPIPRLSIVRKPPQDSLAYLGPFTSRADSELALMGLWESFAVRRCVDRLAKSKPREPCALAEIASCPAPCTLEALDDYRFIVDNLNTCLAGDIRPVRQVLSATMTSLSQDLRFEQAQEVRDRLHQVEKAMVRKARLNALASCPEIVAARRLDQHWEIHVIRYGLLAGAQVALPGDDPQRIAQSCVATAQSVTPPPIGMPAGSIQEAELIASWMESDGVRLLEIDGTWGWPAHTH
ncbi:MAG: DEDD exonuclease domain-containing protein [Propionibacteriaceae bacterium]|nr:DEDD exonuclease domain-containing protein [Propionibacteriaceae bacterium]